MRPTMTRQVSRRVDRYVPKSKRRRTSVTWKVRTSYRPTVWYCWPIASARVNRPYWARAKESVEPDRMIATPMMTTARLDMREAAVFHR